MGRPRKVVEDIAAQGGSQSTAIINWEEQLAKDAQESSRVEASVASSNRVSVQNAIMKWGGQACPGNEVVCIVLDSRFENAHYAEQFNPNNPKPPKCWAIGTELDALAPHESVVAAGNAEAEACKTCPQNQFGTGGLSGKGKACGNLRRTMLLMAGTLDGEKFAEFSPDELREQSPAAFRISASNGRAYASCMLGIANAIKRPPHGVMIRMSCKPHPQKQVEMSFSYFDKVPDDCMPVVMAKREEAAQLIEQVYDTYTSSEEQPTKSLRGRPRTVGNAPPAPSRVVQGPITRRGPGRPRKVDVEPAPF